MYALVPSAVVLALGALLARKRRHGRVRQRTEQHEALLAFLKDITEQPTLMVVLRRRYGVAAPLLMRKVRQSGQWSEPVLRQFVGELMADRVVRRMVANILARRGANRERVMRELLFLKDGRVNGVEGEEAL